MYCYYTQFSSALASGAGDQDLRSRCLMPQANWSKWRARTKRELFQALLRAGVTVSQDAVSTAFEHATACFEHAERLLQKRFREETAGSESPSVVLLGRPYNVLSPEMSKGIAEIFGALGLKTFSQDMVSCDPAAVERIAPLLEHVHWIHGAKILEVACVVADTPHLYPVFITSFKCSPDSFILEYFKRILDAKGKPYLILQLDDHDSTLGYETRIEAGVASFRNHEARSSAAPGAEASRGRKPPARSLPVNPHPLAKLGDRTLLFPVWDPLVNPLLAANLRREGIDARVLEEDPIVIRKAMRQNTGQCLPLSILVQETADYVRTHRLDPSRTALWMPRSRLSCNIGMFTPFIKSLLEAESGGIEAVQVYARGFFFLELSRRATMNVYKAYLIGGLLRRVGCRLRPYERSPGATDAAIAAAMKILVPAFAGTVRKEDALRSAAALFDDVEISPERRPPVAIFGDLYVRDNDVMNQGLIRAIEEAGGEAVTTPYTEYIRIVAESYFRKWSLAGEHLRSLAFRALWLLADTVGSGCRQHFARFLDPDPEITDEGSERFIAAFGLRSEHAGESFDNLMKVYHLSRAHPELALFVQASPAFCCPSLVTEAMARDIERLTGVPVVSITYDGTGQYRNEVIVPYVKYARRKAPAGVPSAGGAVRGNSSGRRAACRRRARGLIEPAKCPILVRGIAHEQRPSPFSRRARSPGGSFLRPGETPPGLPAALPCRLQPVRRSHLVRPRQDLGGEAAGDAGKAGVVRRSGAAHPFSKIGLGGSLGRYPAQEVFRQDAQPEQGRVSHHLHRTGARTDRRGKRAEQERLLGPHPMEEQDAGLRRGQPGAAARGRRRCARAVARCRDTHRDVHGPVRRGGVGVSQGNSETKAALAAAMTAARVPSPIGRRSCTPVTPSR